MKAFSQAPAADVVRSFPGANTRATKRTRASTVRMKTAPSAHLNIGPAPTTSSGGVSTVSFRCTSTPLVVGEKVHGSLGRVTDSLTKPRASGLQKRIVASRTTKKPMMAMDNGFMTHSTTNRQGGHAIVSAEARSGRPESDS
jgi:hypothetical protein